MKNTGEKHFNSNLEECLAMADIQSNDYVDLLKQRINYYQEENAKMESTLLKLKLLKEPSKISGEFVELVEKLTDLQEKLGVKELTPSSAALSQAHKNRKQTNYSVKLKMYIKMYAELNNTILKRLKQLNSIYDQEVQKVEEIVTITVDEVKCIEKKILRYEHELLKLEKKHPWLKNMEYSLSNISKKANILSTLRRESEELVKELDRYCGLKPDFQEATKQLDQIKLECEEMTKKLIK